MALRALGAGLARTEARKATTKMWKKLGKYMKGVKSDLQTWVRDVCFITKPTVREVMEEFTRIPLIDGKTFWELENELEWV